MSPESPVSKNSSPASLIHTTSQRETETLEAAQRRAVVVTNKSDVERKDLVRSKFHLSVLTGRRCGSMDRASASGMIV